MANPVPLPIAQAQAQIVAGAARTWSQARSLFPQVARYLTAGSQGAGAVDVKYAGSRLRVNSWIDDVNVRDGELHPIGGGFEVRLNPASTPARKRMTMAHELGHTLFYDLTAETPVRLRLPRREDMATTEERLCDDFARELLLPEQRLGDVSGPFLKSETVHDLVRRFEVSYDVLLWRLFRDLHKFPCTMAFFLSNRDQGIDHDPRSTTFRGLAFPREMTAPKLARLVDIRAAALASRVAGDTVSGALASPLLTFDCLPISKSRTLVIARDLEESA